MQINGKLVLAITTRAQRQQRRNEALKLIADGIPPPYAASTAVPMLSPDARSMSIALFIKSLKEE